MAQKSFLVVLQIIRTRVDRKENKKFVIFSDFFSMPDNIRGPFIHMVVFCGGFLWGFFHCLSFILLVILTCGTKQEETSIIRGDNAILT